MYLPKHNLSGFQRVRGAASSLILLLALLGTAVAQTASQPLASLTPAGNFLVLSGTQDAPVASGLKEELAGLDWQSGFDTLQQLVEAGQSLYGSSGEVDFMSEFGNLFNGGVDALSFPDCPALEAPLTELLERTSNYPVGTHSEFIVSVGFAPANPLSAGLLLVRADEVTGNALESSVDASLECLRARPEAQVVERIQDDSRFYEISVDYDMAFSLAFEQNVLFLSSNPDRLRAALRLLNGSDEGSFADTSLWQEQRRFTPGQAAFGWTIDLNEAATLLNAYRDMLGESPAELELLDRAVSALRTTGGMTGRLTATAGGLLSEAALVVDPSAGDEELARLLLGSGLTVGAPPLLPGSAVLASSQVFDLTGLVDYVQGWLDSAVAAFGEEPADLRSLLHDETGFDLDSDLLDWFGNEIHVVQLQPSFQQPLDLLFGGNQVYQVPVTSEGAARASVERLAGFLFDLSPAGGQFDDMALEVSVRNLEYRDVDITRVQFGPNLDAGFTVLADTLLIGLPARALQPFIDQQLESSSGQQAYPFAQGISQPLVLQHYTAGEEFLVLNDLLAPFTQPVAFGILAGLSSELASTDNDYDNWVWNDTPHDLQGVTLLPGAPGSYSGELSSAEDEGEAAEDEEWGEEETLIDYYSLDGVAGGDRVTVTLQGEFDTYLYLLDGTSGEVLLDNDDWGDDWYTSRLEFTVEEGQQLVLGIGSYWGSEDGSYDLEIELAPAGVEKEPVTLPSFAAVLDMLDLLPAAARITGERIGDMTGWQERDGNVLYSRSLLEVDW